MPRIRVGEDRKRLEKWQDRDRAAKRHSMRNATAACLMFGLLFVGLIFSVSAGAADTEGVAENTQPTPAEQRPTADEVREALDGGSVQEQGEPLTDPVAAKRLPHVDLDRTGAEELVSSVFGPVLEGASGVIGEIEPTTYHGNNAAVVSGEDPVSQGGSSPDNGPVLVESTLPLRTKDSTGLDRPVDLNLTYEGGALVPSNPLVEVAIPGHVGEGVSLPEVGVEITPETADAADRAPSLVKEGVALYPNIAPDSDLTVAPTPEGVETLTQIRSADAPRTETFDITMPIGVKMEANLGGAVIKDGQNVLVNVPAPSAIDAAGDPVPVDLTVSGSSLQLSVSPSADAAYPILIDPVYQVYTMGQLGSQGAPNMNGWSQFTPYAAGAFSLAYFDWCAACNDIVYGLELNSVPAAGIPYDSRVRWDYYVPRWGEAKEPTSYIDAMQLGRVGFDVMSAQNNYSVVDDPLLEWYIWSDANGFISLARRNGTEGNLSDPTLKYYGSNVAHNTTAKRASIELVSVQNHSQYRHAYVGDAVLVLSDNDFPGIGNMGAPAGWVNNTPTAIPFEATDTGLGVYRVQVQEPTSSGGSQVTNTFWGCTGIADNPCPRTWNSTQHAITWDPSVMPQGEDFVKVWAVDALEQASQPSETRIKVDHTAPALSVSGSALEQATVGTGQSSYTVKLAATDGTTAAPQSGVVREVVKVDNVVEKEFTQTCTKSCEMAREWILESRKYADGVHTIEVFAVDGVGLASPTKTFTVDLHPDRNPPTLSLSGSITEQAGIGTTLPRYALKVDASDPESAGTVSYGSAFGAAGAGNGQFSHPSDVASDAAGNLWVVDEQNNRIEKFNEKGEFLAKYGSTGTGNGQFSRPTQIAIANGNVFVTDAGNKRVEKFNESGVFLAAFGSSGTGNGQFSGSGPEGLAVDGKGSVWVSDTYGARLEKFSEAGAFQMAVGVRGSGAGQLVEPTGLDIDAQGDVWVADWSNNRIVEFSGTGTYLRQVGSAGTANGQFQHPDALDVDSKGDVWVGDQGNGRVERFGPSGEFKAKYGLGGSGAGQFSFSYPIGLEVNAKGSLFVADANNARIQKWTNSAVPGSGVASIQIKRDGNVVDSASPGCPAGGCSLSREWSLTSGDVSAGSHAIEVIVTDASGLTSTKQITINIARDQTAPTVETGSALFNAPEGWVDQKGYAYSVTAEDPGGYGTTSLVLKIDGEVVDSASQTCANGSCPAHLTGSIDASDYEGGAHAVEAVATDAAGNVRRDTWTMNVDPSGNISADEAQSTIEAMEATNEESIVSPNPEPVPGLDEGDGGYEVTLAESSNELTTEGAPAETTIPLNPEAGFTIHTSEGPVTVEPVSTAPAATETTLASGASGVVGNASKAVDTVIRPIYDGAMQFENIRDASAPETFSWQVHLEEGQYLESIDVGTAEVFWDPEHPAFFIQAGAAHDILGATVPTSLSVSGEDEITLTVKHREGNPASGGAPFVYPILSGTGWEGGYVGNLVNMPPPEPIEGPPPPEEEPSEEGNNGDMFSEFVAGAPQSEPAATGSGWIPGYHYDPTTWRPFGWRLCPWGVCGLIENKFKGFFWYDGTEAWYTREPSCTPFAALNFGVNIEECNWVGGNHQKYGEGFHITARTQFNAVDNLGVTSKEAHHAEVARAFGDGEIFPHETANICNPSRPGC